MHGEFLRDTEDKKKWDDHGVSCKLEIIEIEIDKLKFGRLGIALEYF